MSDSAGRIRWGERGQVFEVIVKSADARSQVDALLPHLAHHWARTALISLFQHGQIDLVESNNPAMVTKVAGGAGPVNARQAALTKFAKVCDDLAQVDATDPRRGALLDQAHTMRAMLAALGRRPNE